MSENTPTSGISADYAQRITDDLAANRSEQDRARAELTRLQDELIQLEEGEQILVKMQEVLGVAAPAASRSKTVKAAATVPAARSPKAKKASPKAGSTPKPRARTDRQKPTGATGTAKKSGEPTWRELVTGYLADQREPKSAAEVAAALTEAHPQRTTQVTVVRNTLEQGVAHGLLERSKQGRSVYYSPVPAAKATGAAAE
ncbi:MULTISPECIES: hypothetical protein [Streptomyces]|uniref:Regulatory protein n=1 Tax=Streptomyces silvae TaxID=2803812 RepID=A0ABU7ZUK3_9ACTN|nr:MULTISPECIES: hypothetical protein [unclassified Streptomyces]WSS59843.1 hypothetical protein OG284_00725 [Streptomyces sp. NBC_01177]WSS66943.1 hypothetical protein OG491_00920 [Streptomyces sp. NBC_01175]MDX3324063.1 hypothetical protein [Streptomyces sp. ME02-6979-3A]MDX3428162.1 hypothetical protein [Streptomyces sp. ME01-18a]RPK36244.1 hypothetical protein EES40_29980 [Streptomyces sp. ADI93-02]